MLITMAANLYQLILKKLSSLPEAYLQQVDAFLSTLPPMHPADKERNRQAILALAGSWSELAEEEVAEIRAEGRRSGEELFGREVEW